MSENYKLIHDLAKGDATVLEQKGKTYGDSWKRRGGVGAMMMLARKWDRIENISREAGWDIFMVAGKDTGGILDDIQDLRCYLLLVESHVRSELLGKLAPTLPWKSCENCGAASHGDLPCPFPAAPKPLPGVAPSAPATPVPPTSATAHQQPTTLSQCRHCGAVGNHAGFPCPQYQYDQMKNSVGSRACKICNCAPCECGKPTRDYVDQG